MVDLNQRVNAQPVALLKTPAQRKARTARDTAGPAWYGLPAPDMTPELANDLRVLSMRRVLDPKQHYKRSALVASKYLQVGTVVEGKHEYYSDRVPKRQRGATLVDSLLKDQEKRKYFKRRFAASQLQSQAGRQAGRHSGGTKPWAKKHRKE